ncbi:RICIN domain-containing protein [Kitasatospora sp. NPDC096147]|uniref:RICIN domain-containing protein n=1 Tax=Kitasatospora sp. NPDC096147 TaxID=3364093 RepID=UPI003818BBBB
MLATLIILFLTFGTAGTAAAAVPAWNLGNTALANAYNMNGQSSGPVRNTGLGKCMDDYAFQTANGAPVVSYDCNGKTNQNWTFTPMDRWGYSGDLGFHGTISLDNAPGKCLDIPDPTQDGSTITNGTKLELWDCNGRKNQQWIVQYASNGSTRIYNADYWRCVDVNGGSTDNGLVLQVWTCNGSRAQWFAPPGAPPVPTGPIGNPSLAKCVDDPGGNLTPGTKVQSSRCTGSPDQVWKLDQDGSVSHGPRCLNVGGGTGSGSQVDLQPCTGGLNQQWVVRLDGENRTTLLNPESGRCLDIPSSSTADGAILQIWTCNNTAAQVWNAPKYPGRTFTGPVVAPPVVYPAGTGELFRRTEAMKDAQTKRDARARMAVALRGGGFRMRTEAGAALASNDADLTATWNVWNGASWSSDPTSALSVDVAAAKIADQARGQRSEGREHFLDGFSMYENEPSFDGEVIGYMSSGSTFWRAVDAVAFDFSVPRAAQAEKDRVTAIALEHKAKDPQWGSVWDTYADQANRGSADDVRRFIQFNGYPTTAPEKGTPEFRIEVEALKARWAGGDPTNPFDPQLIWLDVEEAAWAEYQTELNSQAPQRAAILTAETRALEALKTGSEAMNDVLSYAWYADRLLWAQQYRANGWNADVARIPGDMGLIKARVTGLAEAAKVAAGQAQDAAAQVQTAQDAATVTARTNGTPQGRGLTYALQSAQVTKATASAAVAVSNAIQTAVAATNATAADSATLFATARAQAHAARAQFLRELAQGDARLAAELAASAQQRADSAAAAAQRAAAAKGRAQQAEKDAGTSAAAAHQSALTAAQERARAGTARAKADAERAKAEQAEAKAQQFAATAVSLRDGARASESTAAARNSDALQAEGVATAARDRAVAAARDHDAASARADAAEAEAAKAVGTANAAAARAAADRARADAAAAGRASDAADTEAGRAGVAAGKSRKAATEAGAAAGRAKAAADRADADTAATRSAALAAHAAAADAIDASDQAATDARTAQLTADQAATAATSAKDRAAAARTEAQGAVAESAAAAGSAWATNEAAQEAASAAATVAAPADAAIDLAAPYAKKDAAAGLATLASQAAKTTAQQQAAVAAARATEAATAAQTAQAAADRATGEAKLAAVAAADAAKSASKAARSAADAMASAAAAATDTAAAVQASAHSDELYRQALADRAAAGRSAQDAATDAAAANSSATSAETDAAGARRAAATADAAATEADRAAAAADASATSAEQSVTRTQQAASDARAAADRAGYEQAGAKGWCATGSTTVCADSTNTGTGVGTPGSRPCTTDREQYNCDFTVSINADWVQAFYRAFPKEQLGDCRTAGFGNVACQPAMFLQSAVIAAAKAGVDPRMVLSIALMESRKEQEYVTAYGVEGYLLYEIGVASASARGQCPGHGSDGTCSLGITNIKPSTWDVLVKAYPGKFRADGWGDLASHTDLAMEATAYYVKYLQTVELPKVPAESRQYYSPYQLVYGFYNGGIDAKSESYRAFYDNVSPDNHYGRFGTQVSGTLNDWETQFWGRSKDMVCGTGILTCTFS